MSITEPFWSCRYIISMGKQTTTRLVPPDGGNMKHAMDGRRAEEKTLEKKNRPRAMRGVEGKPQKQTLVECEKLDCVPLGSPFTELSREDVGRDLRDHIRGLVCSPLDSPVADIVLCDKLVLSDLVELSTVKELCHYAKEFARAPDDEHTPLTTDDQSRVEKHFDDCVDRARYSVESLYLWLLTIGFVFPDGFGVSLAARRTFLSFFVLHALGVYEDYMKFVTCAVQYEILDESTELGLPSLRPQRPAFLSPRANHFLRGAPYKWFLCRTSGSARLETRLRLGNAIGFLKKRQPPIPDFRLEKAVEEWRDALFEKGGVNPLTVDWRDLRSTCPHFDAFVNAVVVVCAELFPTSLEGEGTTVMPRAPKTKARTGPLDFWRSEGDDDGHGMWARGLPVGLTSVSEVEYLNGVASHAVDTVPGIVEDVPLLSYRHGGDDPDVVVTLPVPLRAIRTTLDSALLYYSGAPLRVDPVALAEPFKVRMISKPPADAGVLASYLQAALGRGLLRLPGFSLTKQNGATEGYLSRSLRPGPDGLASDEFFVSGDYKASTDKLSPYVSLAIADIIADRLGLDPLVTSFFRRALCGHETVVKGEPRHQTWGQLMGSPVSFPVLCIANFCMTLSCLPEFRDRGNRFCYGRRSVAGDLGVGIRRHLREVRLLVNGDDVCFTSDRDTYLLWLERTKALGLSPSPGKNFVSRRFVQLNSVMMSPDPSGLAFSVVPDAQIAVLSPPRRVSDSEAFARIGAWQREFLRRSGDRADELNSLFLRLWSPRLAKIAPSGLHNWFLPQWSGGLGLRATRPVVATDAQLRAASYLRSTMSECGRLLRRIRLPDDAPVTNAYELASRLQDRLVSLDLAVWRDASDVLPGFVPSALEADGPIFTDSMIDTIEALGLGAHVPDWLDEAAAPVSGPARLERPDVIDFNSLVAMLAYSGAVSQTRRDRTIRRETDGAGFGDERGHTFDESGSVSVQDKTDVGKLSGAKLFQGRTYYGSDGDKTDVGKLSGAKLFQGRTYYGSGGDTKYAGAEQTSRRGNSFRAFNARLLTNAAKKGHAWTVEGVLGCYQPNPQVCWPSSAPKPGLRSEQIEVDPCGLLVRLRDLGLGLSAPRRLRRGAGSGGDVDVHYDNSEIHHDDGDSDYYRSAEAAEVVGTPRLRSVWSSDKWLPPSSHESLDVSCGEGVYIKVFVPSVSAE
nr:MAG: hypothetical protein [Chemarfal virus 154]